MQQQVDVQKVYRASKIISVAMLVSVLVYPVIVEFMKRTHQPFEGFAPQNAVRLPDIFYGLALLSLVGIRVVRKAILKRSAGDDLKTLVAKLHISNIATYALSEVPAILGLVLFLIGGYTRQFYALLLFALLLMVLYFPKLAYWEAWLRKMGGYRSS